MKRCCFVALVFFCVVLPAMAERAPGTADFFVSPRGNDHWGGSLPEPRGDGRDGPFATIERARDAVREKLAGGYDGPITVMLRGGVYTLSAPLQFAPEDSGKPGKPVTYMAYPGEKPILSGGVTMSTWEDLGQGVFRARLDGFSPAERAGLRSLYIGGLRRPLARTPDAGAYHRIAAAVHYVKDPDTGKDLKSGKFAFRFHRGDMRAWPDLARADVVVLRNWESAMLPIRAVDESANTVLLSGPMKWEFRPNLRYYVEGLREDFDSPGEWWVDPDKGVVLYRPLPGETAENLVAVAPRLRQLLVVAGDPALGMRVEHLVFDGIAFRFADYTLPATGHSDWQAAVTIPAAIQLDGARDVTFRRCEVRNIGLYGLWMRRGCRNCRVEHCELTDLGAGGVRVGEAGIRSRPEERTSHCTVSNSFIHDGSKVYYGAIPVWIGQSSDNTISHNEICDFNYTGISVGWSWGFAPTTCHRNLIEYNHLHHLGRGVLYDMAAIYTLGISTGTVIRLNHIHDIWGFVEGYGAGGIYPDEGSSGLLIEKNLVYRTQNGGLTMHYGRDIVARNNIFALGQRSQIHLGRADKKSSQTLLRNIVYYQEGILFQRMSELTSDYNLYWNTQGPEAVRFPGGVDLAAWQKQGYDRHSLVADPLFMDPEHDDFRLRPGSPALRLGFEPFDISKAGLFGEAEWVARPRRIPRERKPLPVKKSPPPIPIVDNFDSTPVGEKPASVQVQGDYDGASVTVSDRRAVSDGRALCFVDAPGLKHSWEPHVYGFPNLVEGRARGDFDLWLGPGAIFAHEWRTNDTPYVPGPSLRIEADGRLMVAGREVVRVPREKWFHLSITAPLGKAADGTWHLEVRLPGETAPREFDLTCAKAFTACNWVVYISDGNEKSEIFLDNLRLEAQKP